EPSAISSRSTSKFSPGDSMRTMVSLPIVVSDSRPSRKSSQGTTRAGRRPARLRAAWKSAMRRFSGQPTITKSMAILARQRPSFSDRDKSTVILLLLFFAGVNFDADPRESGHHVFRHVVVMEVEAGEAAHQWTVQERLRARIRKHAHRQIQGVELTKH